MDLTIKIQSLEKKEPISTTISFPMTIGMAKKIKCLKKDEKAVLNANVRAFIAKYLAVSAVQQNTP